MQWGSVTLAAVRLDAVDRDGVTGGIGDSVLNSIPNRVFPLHPVELARANSMAVGRERDRFLNGRIAVRRFAAELLGTRAEDLLLDYACANCGLSGAIDHGRPGYRAPASGREVRLSLSRSGLWCLLAATTDPAVAAVGADLEDTARAGFAGFDEVVLTPRERALLNGVADESRASALRAQLWSRKEAFLKATGAGLFREPSSVEASDDRFEGIELADIDPAALGLPAELVAAVAIRRLD
jgi:4'-phosphopantetheinyl transferase